MNRETAKRLWEVIKAYGEGKTIQYKARDTGRWCDWKDSLCSDFTFYDDVEYRIKPEEDITKILEDELKQQNLENKDCVYDFNNNAEKVKEKHYRPFEDVAELMLHYAKHFNYECENYCEPIIWVKDKNDNRYLITGYDESCVFLEDIWIVMKDLFEKYTFLDNSACGVENEI